jgi:hypothetical protein
MNNWPTSKKETLLATVVASSLFLSVAYAQTNSPRVIAANQGSPSFAAPSPTRGQHSPYRPGLTASARNFYQLTWGVEPIGVKEVSSGLMIRFSYRVVDPEKAKALNDKKATPYLIDEKSRVKLVVPSLEKVGQLRQTGSPEAGKIYWMVFSNKGNIVKRGTPVSVEIGKFRVDRMVVQ